MATDNQFDALADRLRKMSLDAAPSQQEMDKVMKMSLTELSQCPIDFGKAHLGKRYQEMVSESKYLTWFAETYKNSKKLSHIRFLRFIQLHVDQMEALMETAQPKSKAKAKGAPRKERSALEQTVPHDPWHPSSEEEEEEIMSTPWEPVHGPSMESEEMVMMRERMGEMENTMQQILRHLTGNQ